jgi:hypothetical protein
VYKLWSHISKNQYFPVCTIAKRSYNISANEMEQLVFYTESEEQFISNESDQESTCDFLEIKDNNVSTNQE